MKEEKNIIFFILIGLFFLNILAWIVVYDLSQPSFLEVNFFDVGQGDAIFVETPKRQQILIDGGPSLAILDKLAKEMPFWDRNLDLIILTHPENDHLRGLIEVLKRYKIENILWTGVVKETAEYKEWLSLIEKEGAKIFIANAPQKIVGLEPLNFLILYPLESLEGKVLKDINNTSIVAKLVFGENSFLFTGDIYKSGEKNLLEADLDIDSDILKIAHHGSKSSSAEEFIEKVSPKIAVIPVGKRNRYGHPHQEVLEILKLHNITILRTDQQGDIKIISDGKNFKIK